MIRERVRMSIKVRVTVRIRVRVRRVRGIWLCFLIVSYELAISEQEVMSQRVSRVHGRVTNQAVRGGGGGGGESGCQGGGGGGEVTFDVFVSIVWPQIRMWFVR